MKITILQSEEGDWCGLYVDGELKREGHSLSYRDAFEILDIKYETIYITEDELCEKHNCRCPKLISDLKR